MGSFFSKATVLLSDPTEFATLSESTSETRHYKEYDYVIVGAGAAGPVLAHRLSENPNISVLLIEAGNSNDTLFAKVPLGSGRLWRTAYDWQYWTTPQTELNGRKLYQPRGKLLGGSTSINAMMYQHAAPSDLDEWEHLGAKGWNANDMAKYFRMSEKNIPHVEYPINHEHRGTEGLWHTTYTYTTELSKKFLKACVAFGIPYIPDINTPLGSTGVTRVLTFICDKGSRASAATAYLDVITLARPNLTVAINTQATRVLFSTDAGKPRAIGVEMAKDSTSPLYRVSAKKEVIISAGAFGTPQLLNLSGIGARADLEKVGIEVVKDLPAVGEHLSDHLTTGTVIYRAKEGTTLDYLLRPLPGLPPLIRWLLFGTGPLTTNAAEVAAFFRIEDYPEVDKPGSKAPAFEECASGPKTANTELIGLPVYLNNHTSIDGKPDYDCLSLMAIALRPFSKGTVKLVSKSAFDYPNIDPKYLSQENDLKLMIRSVRVIMKIGRQEQLKDSVILEPKRYTKDHHMWLANQDPDEVTDAEIEEFIRARAETLYHPVGTARMGHDEKDSVLDSDLKVRGIDALRVCDASAFPAQITGHPTATVIAMAEKLSFEILAGTKDAVLVNA